MEDEGQKKQTDIEMSYSGNSPETQSRSALHEEALAYAERGIPVFPCKPLSKEPATPNGFHDASADPAQINLWWEENPEYNVAFQPQKAGLAVIDPDGEPGLAAWANLELEYGNAPETYTVRTPRGGLHLYFRGDLPPSQSLLGDHVDTRGGGSYVLVPPSRTADGAYRVECNAAPAPLPAWVAERLEAARRHKAVKVESAVELDTPSSIGRATAFAKSAAPSVEGAMGDKTAYVLACDLLSLGLSPEKTLEIMLEHWNDRCEPPWDEAELQTKVNNAASYAQNDAGAWAVEPSSETFGFALDKLVEDDDEAARPNPYAGDAEWNTRVASFRGREPDEDADQPEPEFWDDDGVLPKFPGGCTGVAYGQSGAGKTTVVLALLMDAIQGRGARVAVLAGEGSYGLGKMRVPAQCDAHGITPKDLRGRYRTIPRVPNLTDRADIEALIEAQRDFNPDIVVIDTLATALPGADENAASTGSLLTGNGPAGRLHSAFNAAVIFVAHSGKDASKGPRGSSAFVGNVDFVWEITTDKLAGTARLHVRKMRDGPEGFSVYFRIERAANGVPVARRISESDYRAVHREEVSQDRREVYEALKEFDEPVSTRVLAATLVPPEKRQSEEELDRLILNETKRLQFLARPNSKTGAPGVLASYVVRDHRGEALKPLMWQVPCIGDLYDDGDDEE
ncbi:bifunctional DNA primase/polymerase [Phenylobacterium sp.]|uniref:bifunctional DNA primase/polymerase n=1 Tax=Phenylobacterium sp. TaxID=1871053 RepID=UPI0035B2A2B9